jgi:hypothetical protein
MTRFLKLMNLSLKQADLQKKIDSSELTPDSPSIVDLNKELDQIKKTRDDLIGEKVVPNIDEFGGFTLSPEELKNITGKPFTESLDKSLDEIFYELDAIKPGYKLPYCTKVWARDSRRKGFKLF